VAHAARPPRRDAAAEARIDARAAGGRRSRIVAVAKLALPILALALLSTVFLLAERVDPDAALPFAGEDLASRAQAQHLTRPRVAGVSAEGTAFRLDAAAARPDPADPRRLSADDVTLRLDGAGGAAGPGPGPGLPGGRVDLAAARGTVDTGARRVVLEGGVAIRSGDGYALRTARLEGALGRLDIRAPGPVAGTGPVGRLDAGGMHIRAGAGGAPALVFTGGVDLLYLPPEADPGGARPGP
jgi:lipopolysaccharide export system protein LptC